MVGNCTHTHTQTVQVKKKDERKKEKDQRNDGARLLFLSTLDRTHEVNSLWGIVCIVLTTLNSPLKSQYLCFSFAFALSRSPLQLMMVAQHKVSIFIFFFSYFIYPETNTPILPNTIYITTISYVSYAFIDHKISSVDCNNFILIIYINHKLNLYISLIFSSFTLHSVKRIEKFFFQKTIITIRQFVRFPID